jgi:glycosyltransferase involved in cell wall biosynthesis
MNIRFFSRLSQARDHLEHCQTAMHSWVVIPAYNEASRLSQVLAGLPGIGLKVVVVDDGSVDETANVAATHGAFVLRHLINRGQGAALRTGIQFAISKGAVEIITFDADGQHQTEDIQALTGALRTPDIDLVLGSRFLGSAPGIPLHRWVILKLAIMFTRLTTGLHLTDVHNGLRAMTVDAARKLEFTEDGMAHASQILSMAAKQKLRIKEVPCSIVYSSQSLEKGQRSSAAFRILGRLAISRIVR